MECSIIRLYALPTVSSGASPITLDVIMSDTLISYRLLGSFVGFANPYIHILVERDQKTIPSAMLTSTVSKNPAQNFVLNFTRSEGNWFVSAPLCSLSFESKEIIYFSWPPMIL